MPKAHQPRHGSMQFWPRKRAKNVVARMRSWPKSKDVKPLGFAGYKVGMTHVLYQDTVATSLTKGMDVSVPATVIECPPIRVFGVQAYTKTDTRLLPTSTILSSQTDKDLERKLPKPKNITTKIEDLKVEELEKIRLLVHTQPKLTSIGKKKPEVFELELGGSVEEQLGFAKENLGKEIKVEDIISPGDIIDIHGITKGKGYQGAVKRFGIGLTAKKSEKDRRTPGSLGPWKGQGKILYRVAHAGQMGYHQRTEYNKWVLSSGQKPGEVNPIGGFKHYGNVKNSYLLIKGSVSGPAKRFIRFCPALRQNRYKKQDAPQIEKISLASKQGR